MRNLKVLVLGLVLTLSTTALAQPGQDLEEPTHGMQPAPVEESNENVATALAVGTTLAGLGIAVAAVRYENSGAGLVGLAGLLIGPSVGHLYAGEWVHALGTSAVRTAGGFVFLVGLIEATSTEQSSGGGSSPHSDGRSMMLLGGAAYVLTTIYDIYDARRAARRSNEHALAVVPTVGQNATVGLMVAGRF